LCEITPLTQRTYTNKWVRFINLIFQPPILPSHVRGPVCVWLSRLWLLSCLSVVVI